MNDLQAIVTEVQECFKNASPEDVVFKRVIESNITTIAEFGLKDKVKLPIRVIARRAFSDKEKAEFKTLGIGSYSGSYFSQHPLSSFWDNDEDVIVFYDLYTFASTGEQVLVIR